MLFRKNPDGSLKYSFPLQRVAPDVPALARSVKTTLTTSTQINLNEATTYLQVYAIAKDVYLKWGTTAVSSSNFDEVIPAGQIREFLVPDGYNAINLIEREAGASAIVIEK